MSSGHFEINIDLFVSYKLAPLLFYILGRKYIDTSDSRNLTMPKIFKEVHITYFKGLPIRRKFISLDGEIYYPLPSHLRIGSLDSLSTYIRFSLDMSLVKFLCLSFSTY
jgi:hypothetical protein